MGAADIALERAEEAGCDVEHIGAVIEHWQLRQPAWAIGALFRRISRARPGLAPAEGWPPPSDEFHKGRSAEAREAARLAREAQHEEERREIAAQQELAAELEEAFGPLVDQMPEEELAAFAAEQLAGNPFLEKLWRLKGLGSPLVREHLIAALAAAAAEVGGRRP